MTKNLLTTADPALPPLHLEGSTAYSYEFFRVLAANMNLGDLPHPIRARNLGLYPVWRQWAEERGGTIALFADLLSSPRSRFEQCVDLFDVAIKSDRMWSKIRRSTSMDQTPNPLAAMATAPLMFWSAPHVFIEPTAGLEQLLANSDLGEDIPLNLLRPPTTVSYIRFGPVLRHAVTPLPPEADLGPIEGVYVFESVRESQRALAFVPIYGHPGKVITGIYAIDMTVKDENESLLDSIQETCSEDPWLGTHFQSIAKLSTMIFLYLNLAQTQRFEENTYTDLLLQMKRVGPKKAAKLQRQVNKNYDRIVLGPQILLNSAHGELSTHWRRGHFRMQPHGPQNALRKVMFIAPTVVRGDRLQGQAPDVFS